MAQDKAYVAVTAGTTQTFAGATPLLGDVCSVTTGVAQDGIILPQGAAGLVLFVKNVSALAAKVYVPNGGTLDGTAGATGVASGLAASKTSVFACTGVNAAGGSVWIMMMASA
jgi:hypothetical protein